jgi:FlaA1/EpsC-like NDP-sugar epimerase
MLLRVLKNLVPLIGARQIEHHVPGTLIYGAGFPATLFIRQCGDGGLDGFDCRNIIGFIDEDSNLRGRIVHGFPVLGSLDDLESIVRGRKLSSIVITAEPGEENMERLRSVLKDKKIKVLYWRTDLVEAAEF